MDVEFNLECYVKLMNYFDTKALSNQMLSAIEINQINQNLLKYGFTESIRQFIHDVADANDCGNCETWNELITELRKLFESGERIRK